MYNVQLLYANFKRHSESDFYLSTLPIWSFKNNQKIFNTIYNTFYHNFIIYYYKYTVLINISCFELSLYYKTYLQKNIIFFLL